ncbi:RUN and FYVE domain-containing protein 4 [Pantherophis guttatus]|uniref:RUN and FYVE domain-containing protein 4 n=1 Tax=Pantherophis guttatus TaxID=94885 RepID=A0A6P9C0C9_PANGU|nr:RUN and FYVE domain-containing protein 4 [Pantherophis guttatus]XP_034277651.1 RUN and FYVE domain-containing protein 4 [Pantherophis guttatus]XP_034277657.1 RUN and FYVE domain-containing protein 4 [Pantherophis guttatus]
MAPDREILHVIKDLKNTLVDLNQNYRERGLPVTDGSQELQPFCAQLEFLLQYDLKEKKNLFGQKKDYWDFLSRNFTRLNSNPHAGVQHVTSLDKLKTAVGKGRAFIRYCLVHQQLAETLQLCFMEPEVTSEWYYARSPFLDEKLRTDILSSLYELDGIAFHLALRREDLDAAWPIVSEILPQFSTRAVKYTQSEDGLSKAGNSNQEQGLHQGSTFVHRSRLRTMDVPDSRVDDQLRPGPEQPLEKWIGVWRSRKNSLLQMGSLLKLNPFMERYVQSPPSGKEQKKADGELQVHLEKEQPTGNVSSIQGLCYPQPKHCLCRKVDGITEGDSLQKQECLRTLIGEMTVLQQKLAMQQEENASLKQTLSKENRSLKEELTKYEEQQKEKMGEQEKQQQELAKVVKTLREAECKIASLTGECQEAWAKKDGAEKALKEAEQRLSTQEAERRKHLAHMEAQDLRQQQLISQCRGLQEKLKVSEKSLDRWEEHVVAMKSQHGQLETVKELSEEKCYRAMEKEDYSTIQEIDPLKERLERSLAEIKNLEKEKETLMETFVSQEQSLVLSKLEMKDLQKELLVCQEQLVTLQVSLEKQEKALRDHEKAALSLQRELNDQSACLKESLEKNTTLETQLEEMASKKFQLEAETLEDQRRWERTLQTLTGQLNTFEKEIVRLQEDKQQLQATLQQALGEREVLVKQTESTTASLKGQTQEMAWLRSELETLKATSQTLQKTQQEKSESIASTLREECQKLKNQVEQLQLEKMQTTNIAKQLSEELEQCWKWPTEDAVLQIASVSSTTMTHRACESKSKEARAPVKERGIATEGIVRSALTLKEIQAEVLQYLEGPVKTGDSATQRIEVHEKSLAGHLDKMTEDVRQAKKMLIAKDKTIGHLMEQLNRSQQEKEQLQLLLEKNCQELKEKEKLKEELSEQGILISNMKIKLLKLLQEKDALWQKTEGITLPVVNAAPQNTGLCFQCKKEFKLMSRRYQCRWCHSTVCHACSVSGGHKERYCIACYQKRNDQST